MILFVQVVWFRINNRKAQPIIIDYVNATFNHPFWTKEEGWTSPSLLQYKGKGDAFFEGRDGGDIKFWDITRIYISNQPNVGWIPMHMGATDRAGALWNYDTHKLIASVVPALEAIQEIYRDLGDPEAIDPALFFKALVYHLEVQDFHTYYVGKHGLWVHDPSGKRLNA